VTVLCFTVNVKVFIHCVPIKNIPDIFDCNLKTNKAILIIFENNVFDTIKHQMAFQFFTSSNNCFCITSWEPQNKQNMC